MFEEEKDILGFESENESIQDKKQNKNDAEIESESELESETEVEEAKAEEDEEAKEVVESDAIIIKHEDIWRAIIYKKIWLIAISYQFYDYKQIYLNTIQIPFLNHLFYLKLLIIQVLF